MGVRRVRRWSRPTPGWNLPDGREEEAIDQQMAAAYEAVRFAQTHYTYSVAGDLTEIRDAKNNPTIFRHDSLGRKIYMNDGDLGVWTYRYDLSSNLVEINDPRPETTNEEVDSTVIYERDEKGRVTKETWQIELVPGIHELEYQYEADGKLKRVTYPDGFSVENEYHEGSGLVHTVTDSGFRQLARFEEYDPAGRPGIVEYGNGVSTSRVYNPITRRLRNISTLLPSGESLQDRWYTYNKTGDVKRIFNAHDGALFDFSYDKLHRLTHADGWGWGSIDYDYDDIGNITGRSVYNAKAAPPANNEFVYKYKSAAPQ